MKINKKSGVREEDNFKCSSNPKINIEYMTPFFNNTVFNLGRYTVQQTGRMGNGKNFVDRRTLRTLKQRWKYTVRTETWNPVEIRITEAQFIDRLRPQLNGKLEMVRWKPPWPLHICCLRMQQCAVFRNVAVLFWFDLISCNNGKWKLQGAT